MTNESGLDVVVFGSAIVDFICYVERLPKTGETLHGYEFVTGFGGKGANQCVAASRLGARTGIIAKLGDDIWGNDYLMHMTKANINITHMKQCTGTTTGIAQIAVAQNGDNHIIIVPGANNNLTKEDAQSAKDLLESAKILLCQLETPVEGTLEALRLFKGISILNAAPALINIPCDLIKSASILCVNEHEAASMINNTEIKTLMEAKAAAMLLVQLDCKCVIITLGSQGAVYVQQDESNVCVHVPAYNIDKVVDTTGAGDCFLGALAYHMALKPNLKLHQHIGFACRAAAFSVQHKGTQCSFPCMTDIMHLLNEPFLFNII